MKYISENKRKSCKTNIVLKSHVMCHFFDDCTLIKNGFSLNKSIFIPNSNFRFTESQDKIIVISVFRFRCVFDSVNRQEAYKINGNRSRIFSVV